MKPDDTLSVWYLWVCCTRRNSQGLILVVILYQKVHSVFDTRGYAEPEGTLSVRYLWLCCTRKNTQEFDTCDYTVPEGTLSVRYLGLYCSRRYTQCLIRAGKLYQKIVGQTEGKISYDISKMLS